MAVRLADATSWPSPGADARWYHLRLRLRQVFAGGPRRAAEFVGHRSDRPASWRLEVPDPNGSDDGWDNYSHVLVRLQELEASARIVERCVDLLEEWPEEDREIRSNVPRTRPDSDTETYRAVEAARGEPGTSVRSDGIETPARFEIRGPSFSNLPALPEMAEGEYVPDLVATLGSLDIVLSRPVSRWWTDGESVSGPCRRTRRAS